MGSGFAGHSSYVESTVSGCSGADNRVHDSSAHLVRWNSCPQGTAVMPDLCQARRSLPTSRLPITNRGKLAFRSLRDEALTKFGEFIGSRRQFPSVIRSTLCAKESSE